MSVHLIVHFGQAVVDLPVLRQFLGDYTILPLEAADFEWAFTNTRGKDFEDALQVAIAVRHDCGRFITFDKQLLSHIRICLSSKSSWYDSIRSMKFLKRNYLPMTVFVTGACVLIIEVVAVRILSPYFGNTIFTVSSVLSVVLAALSVGYYFGGRLADKRPQDKLFFGIILLGGLGVLALEWMQVLFLPSLGNMLPLTTGPLITSILLFFFPSFLLGMLSPFAIKLQEVHFRKQGIGSIAGTMFFFSTVGSITGSLLAGYALVPRFGVGAIIIGVGVVLTALGLIPLAILGLERKVVAKIGVIVVSMLILYGVAGPSVDALYSKNGIYERITIREGTYDDRPARFLYQDRSASAAMFLDGDDLVYDYSKYYALHEILVPEVKRALVIGGGGYSIPKVLLRDLPQAQVDAAEIEPSLVELGEKYFDVPKDEPRLHHHIADGRRLLFETKEPYDLIFSDVYSSFYAIPMHFTTREFFQLAYDKLNEDGIFIANVIGSLDERPPSIILSEVRTLQEVFPNVYLFAVRSSATEEAQNLILVGHKSDQTFAFDGEHLREHGNATIRDLADHQIDITQFDLSRYPVLTDDYAPVESWTAELLRRHVE